MVNLFSGLFRKSKMPYKNHPPSVLQDFSQYDTEYIMYCIEQEQKVSWLEAELHTSDDPKEIAMQTLEVACTFYGGDWAGILEVDLEMDVWNPLWWFNMNKRDKRERDMVGNVHTVKKSKSDWIVVDETHEGIVSKELFQTVASRMKEYKEFVPSSSERNPLRRKVICGTCGFAMSLSNTKNAKYHCRTSHLETGFDCTSEGILQADIHEMVLP